MKTKRNTKIYAFIVLLTSLIAIYYLISLFECNSWMKAFPIQCKKVFDNEQDIFQRIKQVQNNTTAPHCYFFGFKRTITIEYQEENINILSYCKIHRVGALVIIDKNGNLASGFRIYNNKKELKFDFIGNQWKR